MVERKTSLEKGPLSIQLRSEDVKSLQMFVYKLLCSEGADPDGMKGMVRSATFSCLLLVPIRHVISALHIIKFGHTFTLH